jgi:hypothetical protein
MVVESSGLNISGLEAWYPSVSNFVVTTAYCIAASVKNAEVQ